MKGWHPSGPIHQSTQKPISSEHADVRHLGNKQEGKHNREQVIQVFSGGHQGQLLDIISELTKKAGTQLFKK